MTVFDCGCCEPLKRGYHRAIAALLLGAWVYNVGVLVKRPTPQAVGTVAIYTLGLLFERHVCTQHRRAAR